MIDVSGDAVNKVDQLEIVEKFDSFILEKLNKNIKTIIERDNQTFIVYKNDISINIIKYFDHFKILINDESCYNSGDTCYSKLSLDRVMWYLEYLCSLIKST